MIILSQEEENELRQIALSYQLILEINESLPNGTLAKLFIDMSNNGYRYMEMRRFIDPMQFYRRYTQVIREEDIFRFLLLQLLPDTWHSPDQHPVKYRDQD